MISLKRARATCNLCDYTAYQIDSTVERVERVLHEAMERHVAAEHPEQRAERGG